jgi:hypothetical protein
MTKEQQAACAKFEKRNHFECKLKKRH